MKGEGFVIGRILSRGSGGRRITVLDADAVPVGFKFRV